jgi:ribosomal-protein-alanine N-acetyltransferase
LIRKALLTDIDDILKIEVEQYSSPWSRKSFLSELEKNNSTIYVLEKDYILCAYIVVYDLNGEIEIANIAVSSKYQKKGYATVLLEYVIDNFGVNTDFFLEVNVNNYKAINLYKKIGFKEAYRRKKYYGNDDAIIMKLIN